MLVLLFYCFSYNPMDYYHSNPELKLCLDQIRGGYFSPNDPSSFHGLVDNLLHHDRYGLILVLLNEM